MTMTQMRAEGLLIATAINHVLQEPDADEFNYGCCVINCGTCAALNWLHQHNPQWANDAIRAAYPEAGWSWQAEDGSIRWDLLTADWDNHKGCSSVAGVWEPCREEEQS